MHLDFADGLAAVERGDYATALRQFRPLAERGVAVGIATVWRFFERHGISFKKNRARRRAGPA